MRHKMIRGFRTGDIVKAVVTTGKKIGTYLGKVAVRATGSFKVQTPEGPIDGLSWRFCTTQHRGLSHGASSIADSCFRNSSGVSLRNSQKLKSGNFRPRRPYGD